MYRKFAKSFEFYFRCHSSVSAPERESPRIYGSQVSVSVCGELALPEKETAKRHFPLVNLAPFSSGLTAMQAKVQAAITRGLFAVRDALSCARLSCFRGIYGHDALTAEGLTRRPSVDNSPMFSVSLGPISHSRD